MLAMRAKSIHRWTSHCLDALCLASLLQLVDSGSVWAHPPLACSSLGPRACEGKQLAAIPHFPAAVAPLAFLDEQREAVGEYFSEMWERTKQGFSGVWNDWHYSRDIEARKRNAEDVSFSDKCHLIRNREDVSKVFRMFFVYAVAPSVFPYYLIFWPKCLPGTFDLEKHQRNKQLESVDNRIRAVLMSLIELEKATLNLKDAKAQAQATEVKEVASKALEAPSKKAALANIKDWLLFNATALKPNEQRKPNLSDMPEPLVRGAAIGSGSPFPWLPGFILKFGIRAHLERVAELDSELAALGSSGLSEIPLNDLRWVAFDRGIGDLSWPAAKLESGIAAYLKTVDDANALAQPGACHPDLRLDPFRVRLAVIGLQAVSSVRYGAGADLSRSLYQGGKIQKLAY